MAKGSKYWRRVDKGYDIERTFDIFRSEEKFQASDYSDFDELAAEMDRRFSASASFNTFQDEGRELMKDAAEDWFNENRVEGGEEAGEEERDATPSGEVFEPMTPEERDQLHRDVEEIIDRHEREGRKITPGEAVEEAAVEAESRVSVSGVEPEGGQIIGGAEEAVQPPVVVEEEGVAPSVEAAPGAGVERAIAEAEETVERSAAGEEGLERGATPSISIVESGAVKRTRRARKPGRAAPSGGYSPERLMAPATRISPMGERGAVPPVTGMEGRVTPSGELPPGEGIVRNISDIEERVRIATGGVPSDRGVGAGGQVRPAITITERIYNVGASVRNNIVDITSRVVGFINSLRGR